MATFTTTANLQPGVNHINPDLDSLIPSVSGDVESSFVLRLNNQALTEEQPFQYENRCTKNPLYLRWLNTLGGWDYWLFEFNQVHEVTTRTGSLKVSYVDDISNTYNPSSVLKKSAGKSIVVGAESLSQEEAQGIEDLSHSIEVQMWLGGTAWQTVQIQDGTFQVYQSNYASASVEFQLNLPPIINQIGI